MLDRDEDSVKSFFSENTPRRVAASALRVPKTPHSVKSAFNRRHLDFLLLALQPFACRMRLLSSAISARKSSG